MRSSPPPPPSLFVGLSTVPGRELAVPHAIRSLVEQRHPPERIVVGWCRNFARPELRRSSQTSVVNLPAIFIHPLVEVRQCAHDDGPGSKLLCTLPRVLELVKSISNAWLVLADDDRVYHPFALSSIARHARERGGGGPASFYTWDIWLPFSRGVCYGPCVCPAETCKSKRKCCYGRQWLAGATERSWFGWLRGVAPTMRLGQGADLFALPLSLLGRTRAFFDCAVAHEPLVAYHDDFWISLYLHSVHNVSATRLQPPNESSRSASGGSSGTSRQLPPSQQQQHTVFDLRALPREARAKAAAVGLRASNQSIRVKAACAASYDYMRERCALVS